LVCSMKSSPCPMAYRVYGEQRPADAPGPAASRQPLTREGTAVSFTPIMGRTERHWARWCQPGGAGPLGHPVLPRPRSPPRCPSRDRRKHSSSTPSTRYKVSPAGLQPSPLGERQLGQHRAHRTARAEHVHGLLPTGELQGCRPRPQPLVNLSGTGQGTTLKTLSDPSRKKDEIQWAKSKCSTF